MPLWFNVAFADGAACGCSKLLEDSKGDSTVALLAAQPVDRHLAEVYDDEEEQVHSSMRRVKVEVTRE
jgi:hypothetical protein